jgi:TolB-like protein
VKPRPGETVSELHVIARNSSFTYKGKPVDVKQVGREPGVRYVFWSRGLRHCHGGRAVEKSNLVSAEPLINLGIF